MEERFSQVHDHIAALRAEADAVRLAHVGAADQPDGHVGPSHGVGLRRRAGRALVAFGAFVEGRSDSEGCPDGVAAARS